MEFETSDWKNVYTFTKYLNKAISTENHFTSSLLSETKLKINM